MTIPLKNSPRTRSQNHANHATLQHIEHRFYLVYVVKFRKFFFGSIWCNSSRQKSFPSTIFDKIEPFYHLFAFLQFGPYKKNTRPVINLQSEFRAVTILEGYANDEVNLSKTIQCGEPKRGKIWSVSGTSLLVFSSKILYYVYLKVHILQRTLIFQTFLKTQLSSQ